MRWVLPLALLLIAAMTCPLQALIYPGYAGWAAGDGSPNHFYVGMGTWARSLDTYDHNDSLATVSDSGWTGGSYHIGGENGWDGPTNFYAPDSRAYMRPGETKVWMLYIWAVPAATPSDLSMTWISAVYSDPLVLRQLVFIQKPTGVTGGPSVGDTWTSPPSMTLPFYATSSGLSGYGFRFTLTMVPEPASLLALCVGLVSAGAMVGRKRRGHL